MNKGGSIRLFKSDLMEKMTHVHPITPLVMWVPVIGWLLWRSIYIHEMGWATVLGLGLSGFFVWTLSEYLLHRFVFHFKAQNAVSQRIVYLFHGIHHESPEDATRLVMPPIAGVILASILYSIFRVFLGPIWVQPFFAVFLVGYLCYDYIHFYVHHFQPRTRFGKALKHSHMMHHFVTQEARWGVSSPMWDYVFGTVTESERYKNAKAEHGS